MYNQKEETPDQVRSDDISWPGIQNRHPVAKARDLQTLIK